ncbi:MAG: hypothetical protein JWM68_3595 [Verrucomicrobiales bacterium]|nr:hypothetical protein [Verrucomicrobiales bacterium]
MTTIFGKKGHPETPDALFRREKGHPETRGDDFRGEIRHRNPKVGNFFAISVAPRRISASFSLPPTPESKPVRRHRPFLGPQLDPTLLEQGKRRRRLLQKEFDYLCWVDSGFGSPAKETCKRFQYSKNQGLGPRGPLWFGAS